MAFNDASIRAGFVRKVFGIVTIMLLINAVMAGSVTLHKPFAQLMHQHAYIYFIALLVFIGTYITLVCYKFLARCCPCNLILLTLFTFSAGLVLMYAVSVVPPFTVLLALIATSLTCFGIILFASQTTYDITSKIFIIYAAGMVVAIFGILLAILSLFVYIKWLHFAFSCLVCVTFMVYLALDIQMILGGRKHEISPEDYIYASLMLFLDIYEIFLSMLNILNAGN